jgi:ferredoxin
MSAYAQSHRHGGQANLPDDPDQFELDGRLAPENPDFELESPIAEADNDPTQAELWLPEADAEQPQHSPQLELDGMAPPVFAIDLGNGQQARFQHAANLLSSLEAQQIDVHFQCREGYCGSCRAQLLKGEVHYPEEPMAWLNDGEILLCCCIPRTDLCIRLHD